MLIFNANTQYLNLTKPYSYFYISEETGPSRWLLDCGYMISCPDWRKHFPECSKHWPSA